MSPLLKVMFTSLMLFVATLIFFSVFAFWYQTKLTFYLKKHKHARWCEITAIPPYGSGYANPFRAIQYVYNDLDTEDENILKFKNRTRFGFGGFLVTIAAIFINVGILIAVGAQQ